MTKQDLSDLIEAATKAHTEAGGQIKQCVQGDTSIKQPVPFMCDCGCNGDWTDHTMRLGERGL